MTAPGHGKRALLVDDEAMVKRLQARLLERAGFEIECASTGDEAVELVQRAVATQDPFAVAFVDLTMPGLDGIEAIRKAWELDRDLQVVLCTATPCVPDEIVERLGVTDALVVIKKPFEPVEVVQAALALATKWELARRARAHVDELEQRVRSRTEELEVANQRLAAELTHRDRIEAELRLAQRLEAVGQLAAGVAHEINTPIQYVGDNVQFLRESSADLLRATLAFRALAMACPGERAQREVAELDESLELDYLVAELPHASTSIELGVKRISSIVRALKELSHPGIREAAAANLNRALEHALEVSAHSYRYVADLDAELGQLPLVTCHVGELSQVFVNLIVNAAHAMEGREGRGRLGVRSAVVGERIEIAISDTGCGIPDAIRDRIFDPFFTTKEVGRGTGQGLAIARAIIARHQGSLTVASAVGVGTTFTISLPIDADEARAAS